MITGFILGFCLGQAIALVAVLWLAANCAPIAPNEDYES